MAQERTTHDTTRTDTRRASIIAAPADVASPAPALRRPTGEAPPALRRATGESPPGHDPNDYSEAVEARMAAMRALLEEMRPASDAEALRALRAAFPETSLAARVAAISRRMG